jgi:5'-3' exonuclease
MKCIVGDKSDSIPKIFDRIGEKTALKLIEDKSLLLKKFSDNPGSFDKFCKNNLIINFDNIPIHLVDVFNKTITF